VGEAGIEPTTPGLEAVSGGLTVLGIRLRGIAFLRLSITNHYDLLIPSWAGIEVI